MEHQPIACQAQLAPPSDDELKPLLDWLLANKSAKTRIDFPRGTVLADGRLDLCKQSLGPSGTAVVAEALKQNTFVQSLLLGANRMGDAGAQSLATLVRENRTLTTIFLGCNLITSKGAAELADALKHNPSVRGLWLKRNDIGSESADSLAELIRDNPNLRTLDLVQTGLRADKVASIAKAVVGSPSGVERLYLCGLGIEGNDIDWLIELLSAPSALRALYLGANRLGEAGVHRLAERLVDSKLTTVSLASNGIGPAGMLALTRALQHQETIISLDLGMDPSAGVVEAQDNHFGDEGATALADLLGQNDTLQHLRLGGNRIGDSGLTAIADALQENHTLRTLVFGDRPPEPHRTQIYKCLERNRKASPHQELSLPSQADVRAIKSVYRDAKPPLSLEAETITEAASVPVQLPRPSKEELAQCARTLEALAELPEAFSSKDLPLRAVRAGANRLIEALRENSSAQRSLRRKESSRRDRINRVQHDRTLAAETQIRALRTEGKEPVPAEPRAMLGSRRCYVCKAAFQSMHFFYDYLCSGCAEINYAKRSQTANVRGSVAVVTGGRIKIGYHASLKLLRGGARVIVTTRFPCDAAERFGRESDFEAWRDRLEIHGLDLRHLAAVQRFSRTVSRDHGRLDILINNAAQTVRRPAAWYEDLVAKEVRGPEGLPQLLATTISRHSHHAPDALPSSEPSAQPSSHALPALRTQHALLDEDVAHDPLLFPSAPAATESYRLDKRQANSWTHRLGRFHLLEFVEVQYVNVFAPFMLVNELLPLMERTSASRFVVNVSAMEGKFTYSQKRSSHPHTNMAKAALNMLCRTVGAELAERGIYMTSVDPGWVTNEQPHQVKERMQLDHGFEPPLDETDGASRVLDPVFSMLNGGPKLFGCFLKDYRTTDW
jgi:NAD(P)-dependent dehydrogenase (short-subunit alcohol dehydrogenase family)